MTQQLMLAGDTSAKKNCNSLMEYKSGNNAYILVLALFL